MADAVRMSDYIALSKFIAIAIRNDISMRTALAMFREAGGSIRTETFCNVWAIVRDSADAFGMAGTG